MKFKKGDQIIVILGKDKGRKGKIEKIFPKTNSVIVPGINMVKKHVKPKSENQPGGIVEIAKPIHISKVVLVCSKCGKQTKIGYLMTPQKKERICKKCKMII